MKTSLLAVGKLRPAFRAAADDYLERLRRYAPFEERQAREAVASRSAPEQRRDETRRLLELVPRGAVVVALDPGGTSWSTEALAGRLDDWRIAGTTLALLIGGSHGLDPDSMEQAHFRWSLGPLTFPHELARVIVLEQWYRAWTILRREPYHK